MSSLSQFTNKQNLELLWDVLLDELNINKTNTKLIGNIRTVFESNINPFTLRANPKAQIIELNKLFLSQVVLAVNQLFPTHNKQEQHIKRITISDDEVSEPYKIEEIHASRQNKFEKEVERKRIEMENYMTPQKPRELNFSDTNLDEKIKAMDSLVADKMTQRNIEIELFQNNTGIDADKWLTSTETSVKNNRNTIEQKSVIKNNQNNKLKHISIDSNNNITLSTDEKSKQPIKKVSWDDLEEQTESTISIFNKLKKHPIIIDNIQNPVIEINDKQYIEQKSVPLPEIKREEIHRNQVTMVTSVNEPVLPKTEIIKQLNEMNTKIDSLYELIYKLTNLIEKNND